MPAGRKTHGPDAAPAAWTARPILYVYKGGAFDAHDNHFKVGMATAHIDESWNLDEMRAEYDKAALSRVRDQNRTAAGLSADFEIVFVCPFRSGAEYKDYDVHEALKRLGHFPVKNDANAREWFNAPLAQIKEAARDFLDLDYFAANEAAYSDNGARVEATTATIQFRPEQEAAIEKLLDAYQSGRSSALLDAVPRFGKTVTTYGFVRASSARTILILTNRPAVKQGWGEDKEFVLGDEYSFVTKQSISGVVTVSPEKADFEIDKVVAFVSLQDVKGEAGLKKTNHFIFDVDWDLVVFDEGHEGTQTELMKSLEQQIKRGFTLCVTGTSHNLIDKSNTYGSIVSWSYEDEQEAKERWYLERPDEPNPYALLPKMSLKTIDIFQDLHAIQKYGTDENAAFRFAEFFATGEEGNFKHRSDVIAFLENLASSALPYMPYANGQHRHALWCLPSVAACQSMQVLLGEMVDYRNYKVLTVAGEHANGTGALTDVLEAIGDEPWKTRTITLTVGRLTVGVSVPGWDAVLMMSNTSSPITYTQTIFRGKTPCKRFAKGEDGTILPKLTAHVYDFAPDRALSLIIQLSGASVHDANSIHRASEMLNYMSVVSYSSNSLRDYDISQLNHTIRHIQARNVVTSGFVSDALINRSMLSGLTAKDFGQLAVLKGITSVTSRKDKRVIEIAANHFDKPQYRTTEELAKAAKDKAGRDKTEAARELEERRQAELAIKSQLLAVAARLPLLTIAQRDHVRGQLNFSKLISTFDDASWEEFMPKTESGVAISKQDVIALERYFNIDTLSASMNELLNELDEAYELGAKADARQQNEKLRQIWSYIKNPDRETVISRYDVAERLLDAALRDEDGVLSADSTFIDIGCKSGIMLLAAADRVIDAHAAGAVSYKDIVERQLFSNSNSKAGKLLACSILGINEGDRAFDNHTYIRLDKLVDALLRLHPAMPSEEVADLASRVLLYANLGFMRTYSAVWAKARKHCEKISGVIHDERKWPKALAREGTVFIMVKKVDAIAEEADVVFDYCISNPPYQRAIQTSSNKVQPIWQTFVDIGRRVARHSVMIHPARFLANTAKEGGRWAEETIKDPTFKVIKVFADATEVFPQGVDIKGGVVITDFRRGRTSGGYKGGVFIDNPMLARVVSKTQGAPSFMSIVAPQCPFKSDVKGRFRKDGKSSEVKSNAFEWSPDFHEQATDVPSDRRVQIWGWLNGRRTYRYADISHFTEQSQKKLKSWNVLLPKANGSGKFGEVLGTLSLAGPMVGCAETFLAVGEFKTKREAERCLLYMKTKFARACLGALKRTQDSNRGFWRYVPLPDFSDSSDIDWNQPIVAVDQQLYKKYGLDDKEIAFIEANVQEMP